MNIYQHFRPEEREIIDQVLQWKDFVENAYSLKLTDFLDPREQQILKVIVGQHSEVKWMLYGGSEQAERQRAILYPEYVIPDEEDFQITLFEVDYPRKFVSIEHPQVLGSLMSLGLKRGKFGDILVKDDRIQFYAAKEIGDYIKLQLESIGRAKVDLVEIDQKDAIVPETTWQEMATTTSSLRLDTVISSIYNISRQKSQLFIQQGLAKVNWTKIESTTFECGVGDIISVRGHGRSKLISIEGKTKKDKWRIVAGKQK